MADPILLNPDNRMLGGATGDFGMYGGQTDPQFSVQALRADPAAPGLDADAPIAAASVQAEIAEPATLSSPTAPSAGQSESGGAAPAPTAFLISAPAADFHPAAPEIGAGASPLHFDWSPVVHGAGAPTPALAEPASPAAAADSVDPLPTGVVDGIVVGTASTLLDDLAAPAAGVAGGVVSPLVDGVVSPLVETAGDTLSTMIGAVDDTLDGLGGSDPLGGVATLVSLVSVSDMFDLNPVDAPIADAAGDGFGMLDTLVGEELLPDALLGGAHHEDGALSDHLDHPLGL